LILFNINLLKRKKKFKFKQHPKISIISPIYNRAKFILRFLRSIQNQFYEDLEIIFVDDFSTDNSVKMIEKYQREDERIILLKHKKNKGTLITRNDGILFSKGEFIIIPDPDDILSKDILDACYKTSKEKNVEMIRFNLLDKKTNNIFYDFYVNKLESRVIYQPELSIYLFYGIGYLEQIDFNVCNKFIKRLAYIRALNLMNKYYLNQYMTNFEDGIMNYILYRTVNY
jgi:glycosyltransferase involved in cell wall biosynthesis